MIIISFVLGIVCGERPGARFIPAATLLMRQLKKEGMKLFVSAIKAHKQNTFSRTKRLLFQHRVHKGSNSRIAMPVNFPL